MDAASLPILNDQQPSARWWTTQEDGRILCNLCPRACRLKSGDRGFCFVRLNEGGQMVLDTYGRSTGFCIDPIEKKPLSHFLPGTPVLSFGTAGCNLGCKFCQNWDISKSREVARLSDRAAPTDIALAAQNAGCRSVAFTYNDPVIWAEYALDTAAACRALDVKTVAVTAGYITAEARPDFFAGMDAANIDLKAFTESFYYKITGAHLDSVLETIRYVVHETDCWVELTNLIIPDANDDPDELERMCDWLVQEVGPDVPIHFSAFHPDFKMLDRPRTSHETLIGAYDTARRAGIHYVYVGNVHDPMRQSTYCPSCHQLLIERDWHQLGRYALNGNRCRHCQFEIAGHFEVEPGNWGQKRQPIRIPNNPVVIPPKESPMTSSTASELSFTQAELQVIHQAASDVVRAAAENRSIDVTTTLGDLAERQIAGIYVTLKRGETLRGCCGLQGPLVPLAAALTDAGTRTAKHDPRMAPVVPVELPNLNLAISILGPPRPIGCTGDDRIEAVEIGKHGLRIRHAGKVGLLLPSVATEREWNSRQFLDAVCTKAGLPPASWRSDEAEVQIFDGIYFDNELVCSDLEPEAPFYNSEQISALTQWVHGNLAAIQTGATPFYYANGIDDATVQGLVLQVTHGSDQEPVSWMQLNMRDGLPLQATLYQLTQTAAQAMSHIGPAAQWKVNIAVLTSIVHHGSAESCRLEGFDNQRRALIALDGKRWAIGYDQASSATDLHEKVLSTQTFRRDAAQSYSAVCDSDNEAFTVSLGPHPQTQVTTRPPHVAGGFYPADDHERNELVDGFLKDLSDNEQQEVAAAMVPHAGLRFSGKIGADVWRRIKLTKNVLIIGPKHTNDGMEWAVAPHDAWQVSATTSISGNAELAQQIADAVPGMELDSAAHAREHGIEVQLPLLHRIAPDIQVTAIAMSGGNIEELKSAAESLAKLLLSLSEPPLLIISSDMNHFADDAENRRRDRLALDALLKNDPAELLKVCASENISMCGQIPAALVLLTLQAMNKTAEYEEIAYATSADVTGDKSRVVGYAGVLF